MIDFEINSIRRPGTMSGSTGETTTSRMCVHTSCVVVCTDVLRSMHIRVPLSAHPTQIAEIIGQRALLPQVQQKESANWNAKSARFRMPPGRAQTFLWKKFLQDLSCALA